MPAHLARDECRIGLVEPRPPQVGGQDEAIPRGDAGIADPDQAPSLGPVALAQHDLWVRQLVLDLVTVGQVHDVEGGERRRRRPLGAGG